MKWAKEPNRGASWGMEYPFLFGQLVSGQWAVWERVTGFVVAEFGEDIYSEANASAHSRRINRIEDDPTMPAQLDMVP